MLPAPQAPWSQQSHAVGNPASPCGVESCIRGGTGGGEIGNLLIMLVQDVLATGKHLPGVGDVLFALEVDPGVSLDMTHLICAAETLRHPRDARFDHPI